MDRWQAVEESSSVTGDPRRDDELELVDDVGREQRLGDGDAGVDADVASGSILEVPDEFDQPAIDRRRIGPLPVERRRRRDVLGDSVDEGRERLDLAAGPELRPLRVAPAAEDD